jgi:uncharacterized membrane protein
MCVEDLRLEHAWVKVAEEAEDRRMVKWKLNSNYILRFKVVSATIKPITARIAVVEKTKLYAPVDA